MQDEVIATSTLAKAAASFDSRTGSSSFSPRNLASSELTTGAAFIASEALEKHLIDKIGDRETAREYLASVLSLTPREVTYCE